MLTDLGVHAPQPLAIPAVHGSYNDPIFGTRISRISDAIHTPRADNGQPCPGIQPEYSTMSPFNSDGSRVLLAEFSAFGLYDVNALSRIKPLGSVDTSSEPRWSRTDPNVFYFHPTGTNALKNYNVATGIATPIHTFSEYGALYADGESDISDDGDNLVLMGGSNASGKFVPQDVFLYRISTGVKGPVLNVAGRGPIDAVYVSPKNSVLIAWLTPGAGRFQGTELYDPNMVFVKQLCTYDSHKHFTLDADGSEVLVTADNSSPTEPAVAAYPGCLLKINLATGAKTPLIDIARLDAWTNAAHITAPGAGGYALIATYNNGPGSNVSYPLDNEIWKIYLDSTPTKVHIERLAHHRSNSGSYEGQPFVSISHDGSLIVWSSNWDGANVDTYLSHLVAPVPPATFPPTQTATLTTSHGDKVSVTLKQTA